MSAQRHRPFPRAQSEIGKIIRKYYAGIVFGLSNSNARLDYLMLRRPPAPRSAANALLEQKQCKIFFGSAFSSAWSLRALATLAFATTHRD
ncbi:hypothetical protein ATE67_10355 [Sphingopyxis sp. H050]|jgi:hypothetical protein|nr:hypothetical protein ATE67_10355 [Sphingopyxis sp. H050]